MTEMNENFYKIFTTSQGFALIATIDEKQVTFSVKWNPFYILVVSIYLQ